jgi:hypothetical protein
LWLAYGGPARLIDDTASIHPIVGAVHDAFAHHFFLTLSPDAIRSTIAQGFALHVRLHAEELRGRFVHHQGQTSLNACAAAFPPAADEWPRLVADWCGQIEAHVGRENSGFFINDCSTSAPLETHAGRKARTISRS